MNTSFHSSRVTRYKIMNEDGTYASAKQLYEPADTIDKRVQEILEERGAYEFVDRGYLGTIFQEDPDIDVYYLKSHESGVSQGATFLAIELGLEGYAPKEITPDEIDNEIQRIKNDKNLHLAKNAVKRKSRLLESCRELPAGARQRRKKAELALEQPAEEMEFHECGESHFA